MASTWTTGEPTGATRIRLLPNILQDRWTNIQQGEVPCTKWQLAQRAGNPGAIAGSGLIFTKDGGSGWSELYYKDDQGTAKTTQLITDGGVGAPSQAIYGSTYVTLQTGGVTTFTNTQDGFCSAAGRVKANGDFHAAYKVTNANCRTGTGEYTIFFDPALTTKDNYSVVVTINESSTSRPYIALVTSQSKTQIDIQIRRYAIGAEWDKEDAGFYFAVFMSRI